MCFVQIVSDENKGIQLKSFITTINLFAFTICAPAAETRFQFSPKKQRFCSAKVISFDTFPAPWHLIMVEAAPNYRYSVDDSLQIFLTSETVATLPFKFRQNRARGLLKKNSNNNYSWTDCQHQSEWLTVQVIVAIVKIARKICLCIFHQSLDFTLWSSQSQQIQIANDGLL